MDRAVSGVMRREVSLRGAAGLFHMPYAKLKNRVNIIKKQNASGQEVKTKCAGYPTVFSVEEEKDLTARLKDLAGRRFGCTPEQICRAAFLFANMKGINHAWGKDTVCAGKDWFSAFLTRNGDIAVRKPEGLSRARAQGLNHKAVDDYFDLYRNMCTELNICDKPHLIFNVDETGFPLNNVPPKIVIAKGVRDVIKFTSAERGENVTVVACCSASGAFIPPFLFSRGFSPSKHTTIKRQLTLCTTILILQSQNLVSESFSPQLGEKAPQLGTLSKILSAQACILLTLTLFPKTNFYPLHTFYMIQTTPCQKALIRAHPKNINLQDHQLYSRLPS